MDEYKELTRAEIKTNLEEIRNHPMNKGLAKAELHSKMRVSLADLAERWGYSEREIAALESDIDTYFPEEYSTVGRQV